MVNAVSNSNSPFIHTTQSSLRSIKSKLSNIKKIISSDKRPVACYGGEWDLRVMLDKPSKSLKSLSRSMDTEVSELSAINQFIDRYSSDISKSKLNHLPSQFKATMDDVPEMHFKEGTLDEIKAATQSYSHYLNQTLPSDIIGGPEEANHGLHVHIDIAESFKSSHHLGRFFMLLFNVAPGLKAASRINANTVECLSLDSKQQQAAKKCLTDLSIAEKIEQKKVMTILRRALCEVKPYNKNVDVNLQHTDFGKVGTIELRFFQSPPRPQDIHTIISFVDTMVAFAHENSSHSLTTELTPDKYNNVHQLLELFCDKNPVLRQKMTALLEYKELKPVNFVAFPANHWRTRIADAIKMNNAELLRSILKKHKPDAFDVDGIDACVYAQEHKLDAVQGVLKEFNVKNSDSAEDAASFYKLVCSARKAGFDDLQRLRLFREPKHVIEKVIEAKVNNEPVEHLNQLIEMG